MKRTKMMLAVVVAVTIIGCVMSPIPNCPNGGFPEQVPGTYWFICRPPKNEQSNGTTGINNNDSKAGSSVGIGVRGERQSD